MKLYSHVLTEQDVRSALRTEQDAGRIAKHVSFKRLRQGHARDGRTMIEVQLMAAVRDRGRRAGNSGSYGAMREEIDGLAATYDEWGWLLSALYRIDPDMLAGSSPKYAYYSHAGDFDLKTGWTYDPGLADTIDHYGDPAPFVSGYTADRKGRRGFGRSHYAGYAGKERPRTADWARDFYAGKEV